MKYLKLFGNFKVNEVKTPKYERNILLGDEKYILVEPLTQRASCKYGAFTKWCSANPQNLYNDMWKRSIGGGLDVLYLIDRKRNSEQSETDEDNLRFADISNQIHNGDMEYLDEEDVEFYQKYSDDMSGYNFDKIAFSMQNDELNIWDKNNASFTALDKYNIDDLPIDEYVKDKIKEHFGI